MFLKPLETDRIVAHPMFSNELRRLWKRYREAIIGGSFDESNRSGPCEQIEKWTAFLAQILLSISSDPDKVTLDEKIRFCQVQLALGGIRPSLCGRIPAIQRRTIIVANHVSIYDVLIMSIALNQLPRPVTMESGEIAHEILKCSNPIYVCRNKSKESLHEEIEQELGNQPLVIFPESGTTNNNCVIEFATLPFTHRAVYVPVTILYKRRPVALRNHTMFMNHFVSAIQQEAEIRFHDPINNLDLQWEAAQLKTACFNSICSPGLIPRPDLKHTITKGLKHEIFRIHSLLQSSDDPKSGDDENLFC